MRGIKYLFLAASLFLIKGSYAQDSIPENLTGIISVDSATKLKLYETAKTWILTRFTTADNMIQFDDKEQGFIFATCHIIMEKKYQLFGSVTDNNTLTFKLEMNFKDHKFKYDIKNILYSYTVISGGPNKGYHQSSLNHLDALTKKEPSEVQQEAILKLKAIVEEMKVKMMLAKNNGDW